MKRILLALVCISLPVGAVEVYVNGVSVDGLTNHTFEKVTVRLDERGNVQIDAPGYINCWLHSITNAKHFLG